ncbi:HAD-IA family hydrolase [Bacillus salitolerans]|uniref:HAD-IA family hydrolase n=1 Tax=Bacillus salitolerans TaxID=1437434 RepID=A0ABW4LKK7_9BACI
MNILWDFDGTIFDTYPAYTKIMMEIVGNGVSEQEIYMKLKVSFSHAIKHYQLDEEMVQLIRRKTSEIKPGEVSPFSGVEEILKHAKKNVIMTHKEREEVLQILDFHHLSDYFVEIIAGDDGFPRKPDKTSYEFLHKKHGLHLAIGDRELDLIPAKQIGIATCSFQNPVVEADYHLSSYADFFAVLKE